MIVKFPHCDPKVIHAPGRCRHCDKFPEVQLDRHINGINYTGENDPTKATCPAELQRSIDTINKWYGNRAIGLKCTCGSASVNGPKHDTWCDLNA